MAEVLDTKDEQHAAETVNEEKPAGKDQQQEENKDDESKDSDVEEIDVDDDEKPTENEKNNDEEDNESSEEELGSLEKPIEIISRKRDRKSTDRFKLESKAKPKPEDELDYTKGTGLKLADIAFIKHQLDKTLAEDLKPLHKLLFRETGKLSMVKKRIRTFCGYPYEKDSEHYKRMLVAIDRFNVAGLKFVSYLLSLEKISDKEKLKENLIEFLMAPKDLKKEIPQKKRKTPSKKPKKKKEKKEKTDEKKKEGDEKKDDDVSSASDDSDDEEQEDGEKKEVKEKLKKKKKETPKKKETKEKKKKKPTPVKISIPMKKTKKDTPKKSPAKRKSMADSDDDDDNEPLVKKTKVEPTNTEIRKVVSDILKDADLEQVTMKTVCRQVYDRYPDFDLTGRKDFIKTTVKEIIS